MACETDYEQSILYEGFEDVFASEIALDLGKQQADHFALTLQRGVHSGHLKLVIKLLYSSDVEQTLCLMKSHDREGHHTQSAEAQSQQLATALIQKPDMGEHN